MRRFGIVCLLILVASLLLPRAWSQPDASVSPNEAHGWIGTAVIEGEGGVLLHLPPRVESGVVAGADPGLAWPARRLHRVPLATASWSERVFLLFARADRVYGVFELRARDALPGGAWTIRPDNGADALPNLQFPDRARLQGVVGQPDGIFALGRTEEGAWVAQRFDGQAWTDLDLSPSVQNAVHLWPVRGAPTPAILGAGSGRTSVWRLVETELADTDRPNKVEWVETGLTLTESLDVERVVEVFAAGDDVCVTTVDGQRVEVHALGPSLVGVIAAAQLGGDAVHVVPMGGGRRLGVLSQVTNADADGIDDPIREWELLELSLVTGAELYRGEPRFPSLDLGDSVRLLGIAMMALTGCLLFYLVRPEDTEAQPVLPVGFAFAPPGRRALAAFLDGFGVVGVVAITFGLPLRDVVLVLPLFESVEGVVAIGTAIVGGALYSTMSEWTLGATLGKLVTRLRVVSCDPKRPRIGLMRLGARNVFRWALAPWAWAGIGPPVFRHRGDRVARAAVVVRASQVSTGAARWSTGGPGPRGTDEGRDGSTGDQ